MEWDSLPVRIILLALWLGAGAAGTFLILRKGYRVNWLKTLSYYIAPVLAVLYLLFHQIQELKTPWPENLPSVIVNVLLVLTMLGVSPVLILVAYFLPKITSREVAATVERREKISKIQGWLALAGAIFLVVVLPLLALSLFKAAPRYDSIVSVVINGLLSGFVFALIALGYTLVYGIVELINFAHGDVFMMGSLVGFAVITTILDAKPSRAIKADTPFILIFVGIVAAIVIAMIFCGLLNYVINRIAYKPLRNAPRLAPLISAIGVSFVLQNIGLYLNSSAPKGYPILFPNSTRVSNVDIVSDVIGNDTSLIVFPVTAFLVIFGASILLAALTYLIGYTRVGKAMRAVAQNREAAALMGISIEGTISIAFMLGGAFAGAAGVIYGIYQVQSTVRYDLGFSNGLFAFTAAVLGGIGNLNGAVLGGIFIGMVYSLCQSSFFQLTNSYVDLSIWAPVAVFGILVMVMIFRPTGILGDNVQEKV